MRGQKSEYGLDCKTDSNNGYLSQNALAVTTLLSDFNPPAVPLHNQAQGSPMLHVAIVPSPTA